MTDHAFNNDLLLTLAGDLNHGFIRASAKARAIAASDTGVAEPREVAIWEEKLTGMAEMMRDRFMRNASAETRQRFAVTALIGQCEAVAASGALPEPAEQSLRVLIAHALAAFNMPSKTERMEAAE
jgi:hypothetical protein